MNDVQEWAYDGWEDGYARGFDEMATGEATANYLNMLESAIRGDLTCDHCGMDLYARHHSPGSDHAFRFPKAELPS